MGCSIHNCKKKNAIIKIEVFTEQGSGKEVTEFQNALISSRYSILRKLGHGISSTVYLCLCKRTNQEIALKVIQKHSVASKCQCYSKEISIMQKLDHPNILKSFESVEDENNLYISQEYASGCDLRRYMRKHLDKLTEKKLAKIMFQLMLSLSYIHAKNVVHRDIKLENIYLASDSGFDIKLGDFGCSDYRNGQGLHGIYGTTQYMAPEIFLNIYDEKVDIWSAGVMLFVLSTGKNPYKVKNADILIEIIKTQPLSPSRLEIQEKSASFKSFINGLLQKNPLKRFSAREALRHDWINSNIKTTFDSSTLVQQMKFEHENNLLRKVFSLLASFLFIKTSELKDLNRFFQKLDKNFEGSLKKEEFENYFRHFFDIDEARLYSAAMFDSWDLDINGEIQYLEFVTAFMHKKNVSSEKKIELVFSFFRENDESFILLERLTNFLVFCSSGKYQSCLKTQGIRDKLNLEEFKSLLR